MWDLDWGRTHRVFTFGPTFFTDWVTNLFEYIENFNKMLKSKGEEGTERMKVFWDNKDFFRASTKTHPALPAGLWKDSMFETYRAMANWKQSLTKALVYKNVVEKIEENAYNFLWESMVQYINGGVVLGGPFPHQLLDYSATELLQRGGVQRAPRGWVQIRWHPC